MDTIGKRRRSWTVEAKRRITEESFEGKISVAELYQKYAVNANQIFPWRRSIERGVPGNQHFDESGSCDRWLSRAWGSES